MRNIIWDKGYFCRLGLDDGMCHISWCSAWHFLFSWPIYTFSTSDWVFLSPKWPRSFRNSWYQDVLIMSLISNFQVPICNMVHPLPNGINFLWLCSDTIWDEKLSKNLQSLILNWLLSGVSFRLFFQAVWSRLRTACHGLFHCYPWLECHSHMSVKLATSWWLYLVSWKKAKLTGRPNDNFDHLNSLQGCWILSTVSSVF